MSGLETAQLGGFGYDILSAAATPYSPPTGFVWWRLLWLQTGDLFDIQSADSKRYFTSTIFGNQPAAGFSLYGYFSYVELGGPPTPLILAYRLPI